MKTIFDICVCECSSVEHQIVFSRFSDVDEKEVFASIHLIKLNFWKRLVYAIKYLFGYKCKYGAFEEFIFRPEDADKLQVLANYLKGK